MEAPWAELVIVCPNCRAQNLLGRPGGPVPPRVPVDGRTRLNLGGRTYVLEGKLAQGDSSFVYRGRWVVRLGELVVIKVLAALEDIDLFRREWSTLETLHRSAAPGAEHYITRLPTPIAHGLVGSDKERTASVFGWKSGFIHTLADVGRAHRGGVRGEVVVWILKRLLEQLGWIHRVGFVHGAVHPDHILVHPLDHGALLVGWTASSPWSPGRTQTLPALSSAWSDVYPGSSASKIEASPALDIEMACRCAQLVGGWFLTLESVPLMKNGAVKQVIDRGASGTEHDAWALRDALVEASLDDFGPASYNPLTMPGWAP